MQRAFEKIISKLEELKRVEENREPDCDEEGYGDGEQLYDDGRSQGRYEQTNKIIEIVNEVESEYGGGWIPCSERLPNGSELWLGHDITDAEPREFIVMVKGAYEPTTGYYTDDGWVKDIYDKENGIGYANEIVAWRFFPEPYKAESEE